MEVKGMEPSAHETRRGMRKIENEKIRRHNEAIQRQNAEIRRPAAQQEIDSDVRFASFARQVKKMSMPELLNLKKELLALRNGS
jgi:hypothetical protein